jgi:hypothetical protein
LAEWARRHGIGVIHHLEWNRFGRKFAFRRGDRVRFGLSGMMLFIADGGNVEMMWYDRE